MSIAILKKGGSGGVDCDSATAIPENVIKDKTFGMAGKDEIQVGTMPVNTSNYVLPVNGKQIIPKGYQDGTHYVSQNVPVLGSTTITPGTSDQAINSGRYLNGNIYVPGNGNLSAGNIASGVPIFGVTGSLANYGVTQYAYYYGTWGSIVGGYVTETPNSTYYLLLTSYYNSTGSYVELCNTGRDGYYFKVESNQMRLWYNGNGIFGDISKVPQYTGFAFAKTVNLTPFSRIIITGQNNVEYTGCPNYLVLNIVSPDKSSASGNHYVYSGTSGSTRLFPQLISDNDANPGSAFSLSFDVSSLNGYAGLILENRPQSSGPGSGYMIIYTIQFVV